jgi:hypothetical protein
VTKVDPHFQIGDDPEAAHQGDPVVVTWQPAMAQLGLLFIILQRWIAWPGRSKLAFTKILAKND